jgi:SAM-dependent methyltransferase
VTVRDRDRRGGTLLARPQHELIRAQARYCDIAFGTRDLESECGFLGHLGRHLGRGPLGSFLEVWCGPGFHMHWLAARGVRAYGLDPAPEMVAYAREKACRSAEAAEPDGRSNGAGAPGRARPPCAMPLEGDPLDLALPEAVDLALCPRSTLRYLLHDDEVVAHLVAMAKNLGRGGLYVLELDHPRQLFGAGADPEAAWEAERDGVRVTVRREPGGPIDPLTHAADVELVLEVEEGGRRRVIRDRAPLRSFTFRELHALVRLSGVFEWVATFGDLTVTQPFDRSDGARRMVPVLRCCV